MATASAAPQDTQQPAAKGSVKLKILRQTNPRLDLMKIRKLHALYRGGCDLLENDGVMNAVFPRYSHEKDATYTERKKRAFYENVFASVINQTSAGLAQDPVRYSHMDGDPEPDPYWTDLLKNAVSLNLPQRSLDQVLRDWCVEALVCEYAWLQADLPKPDDEQPPQSLGDQEAAGGLRAYFCQWSTEHILDWEYSDDGQLLWVKVYRCYRKAETPFTARDVTFHCYTIWTAEGWIKYEIPEGKNYPQLNDEMDCTVSDEGTHSFGCVPWVMLDFGSRQGRPSLHLGNLLESLCRAHFNVWNGEMFSLTQCNFQQLYEFLAPEVAGIDSAVSDAQTDPGRANREARAPGAVHVRGAGDKAEFISPDMAGAASVKQAVDDIRDAIYRVTQQMALSQDTSGAMLKRSADSKQQDAVAQEIVLGAIGKALISAAREAICMLGEGRGDSEESSVDPLTGEEIPPAVPEIVGYESFDVDDVDGIIEQSLNVEQVNIPSATYQIEQKYRLAIAHLGDSTDEATRMKIRQELEKAITQDQMVGVMKPPNPFDDEDGDEEDEDEDDGGEKKENGNSPFPPKKQNKGEDDDGDSKG